MNILLKLAWRNVWRNKRRTLITLASISFGLAALLFQQSLIKSLQNQLVEKSTRTYTGHLQIHSKETTDLKIPDARISNPDKVYPAIEGIPEIEAWSPKVIFTGLVSSALTSKGLFVVGIDPAREKKVTIVDSYIVEGKYLQENSDKEAMLGAKLARELDLKLGEKLVVMVQASDGSLSAESFRICAIFKANSPSYDGQIIFIPIRAAQRLMVCGPEVSVVSIRLRQIEQIDKVQKKLSNLLKNEAVNVLTWKESSHEIVSIQEFQDAILLVVLMIIFSLVALGIFNTMLMSFFERIREFGLMMALGSKPTDVAKLIIFESVLLGFLGMIVGNFLGCSLIFYFGKKGIPLPIGEALSYFMPFDRLIYLRFAWKELIFSSTAALLTSLIAAIFPAARAAHLKPAEALRHY